MMENFVNHFKLTSRIDITEEGRDFYRNLPTELFNLLDIFGGATFGNGLYRIHSFSSSVRWSQTIATYFLQYQHKIIPFGFDWLGRQFCLTSANSFLVMFDPATGESFEYEQSINLLHDKDFTSEPDNMLSINLFKQVCEYQAIDNLKYEDCLGYKVPLFLGGTNSLENYEIQNMDVYWHVSGEISKKIRDLPNGTRIRNIRIE